VPLNSVPAPSPVQPSPTGLLWPSAQGFTAVLLTFGYLYGRFWVTPEAGTPPATCDGVGPGNQLTVRLVSEALPTETGSNG
jgi:hypothetical protein